MSIKKVLLALFFSKAAIKRLMLAFITFLLLRVFRHGASIGDAFTMLSLCGLYCFQSFFETKKQPNITKEIKQDIETLKNSISSLKMPGIIKK